MSTDKEWEEFASWFDKAIAKFDQDNRMSLEDEADLRSLTFDAWRAGIKYSKK